MSDARFAVLVTYVGMTASMLAAAAVDGAFSNSRREARFALLVSFFFPVALIWAAIKYAQLRHPKPPASPRGTESDTPPTKENR